MASTASLNAYNDSLFSASRSAEYLDVEVAGVKYQIGRFKARDGSWVLMQILTKLLPSQVESSLPASSALPANRVQMSEEDFHSIQDHCLAVCRRYESGAPMPIFLYSSKVFAIRELEYDFSTVMALTIQALAFNLSPFFAGDGLKSLLSSLPTSQPST